MEADNKLSESATNKNKGQEAATNPQDLEAAFAEADREIDEALVAEQAARDEVLGKKDVFVHTTADIPADARLIASVRNRPYTYFIFGMIALAVIAVVFWMVRRGYLIGLGIFAVIFIGLMLYIDNHRVIDVYEDFLVVYNEKHPEKLCIIPNDQLIYWTVVQQYTSVVEIFISDLEDIEQAICVPIHSINSYKVSGLLDKHYHEKSLVEIQRGVRRRKRERSRRRAS